MEIVNNHLSLETTKYKQLKHRTEPYITTTEIKITKIVTTNSSVKKIKSKGKPNPLRLRQWKVGVHILEYLSLLIQELLMVSVLRLLMAPKLYGESVHVFPVIIS